MKTVKIMLTAIAVFAVVGGALAFKAKKSSFVIYTTTTPGEGALCPNRTPNFTTAASGSTLISVTTKAPDANHLNGYECIETYTVAE